MITLAENVQFGSSPNMYLNFYYEKQRNGSAMQYRIKTKLNALTGGSYYGYYINQRLTMDGTQKEDIQLKATNPYQWSNAIEYTSPWYNVPNKTSGTTSVSFYLYTGGGRTATYNYTMDIDPASANFSQSLNSKTENKITMNWTSDSTIDYVWYNINDTGWVTAGSVDATSGSYNITNLTANTSYNIKTRVRRKDSQLTSDSSELNVVTYDYPHCISAPDFSIGNSVTLNIYNPLGRSIQVYMVGADSTTHGGDVITGTTISGFSNSSWQTWWYSTIPNNTSATYSVNVIWAGNTKTTTGGTYSIKQSVVTPSITSGSYQDTNNATINVTGNNQKIIRNQSIVSFTASGLTTKNSATISSCKVRINGTNYNLTVSGTTATGGNITIDSSMSLTATFILTDSRGLTATKDITITMLDWVLPTAIISLQRHNNYYSETDLKVDADYSYLSGNNTINIKARYKKESASSYSSYTTLQDNITSTFTLDNNYSWNIQVVVTDKFGTTTYNLILPIGMPIIYFDRLNTSTGFNCFPTRQNTTEFGGDSISTNSMNIFYDIDSNLKINKNIYVGNTGITLEGCIIESGSNSNGNYVKLGDGTLLMYGQYFVTTINTSNEWHTLGASNLYYHTPTAKTLPYTSTIDVKPYVSVNSDYFDWAAKISGSTDSFSYSIISNSAQTALIRSEQVQWFCIGKWK